MSVIFLLLTQRQSLRSPKTGMVRERGKEARGPIETTAGYSSRCCPVQCRCGFEDSMIPQREDDGKEAWKDGGLIDDEIT